MSLTHVVPSNCSISADTLYKWWIWLLSALHFLFFKSFHACAAKYAIVNFVIMQERPLYKPAWLKRLLNNLRFSERIGMVRIRWNINFFSRGMRGLHYTQTRVKPTIDLNNYKAKIFDFGFYQVFNGFRDERQLLP